ncbi:MAG: hypothetical protein CMJ45_00550 [Planctomyces sp.]|nr:hypothetical protein [Planctomyces sp.]
MREDPVPQRVVAMVGRRANRVVHCLVDFTRQDVEIIVDGIAVIPGVNQCRCPRSCQQRRGPACQQRGITDLAVGSVFKKLVVCRVDHEQVGFVAGQFFHHRGHAIAGIADAAGVDHFPGVPVVGRRQKLLQPTGKRCPMVVGSSVGRRAAEAEDAVGAGGFLLWELLIIEIRKLGRRRFEHNVARVGRPLAEQG